MKKMKWAYSVIAGVFILSTHVSYAETPNADALLQMGHKKKHDGDLDGAIESYKKALEIDPNFKAAESSLEGAKFEKDLALFSKTLPKECQTPSKDFNQTLKCAQSSFVIGGKPINPLVIRDLTTWLSDGGDQVIAVNLLDSQKCDKYYYDYYKLSEGEKYPSIEVKAPPPPGVEDSVSFKYSVEGITKNGIIVIQTDEWGRGGTGVFSSLLFVRIVKGFGFGEIKSSRLVLNHKRILIEKLGELPLGDNFYTEVKIQDNTVFVQSNNPKFPEEEATTKKIILSLEKQ